MANVIIAIGSNYRQSAHVAWASQCLALLLDNVWLSPMLWSHDIHQVGPMYLNRLAMGTTTLTPDRLNSVLKDLEAKTGRNGHHVTIDLDLMLYDRQRYHERDWPRGYIQRLLPYLPNAQRSIFNF